MKQNTPKEQTRPKRRGCAPYFLAAILLAAAFWGCCLGAFRWLMEDAETTIEAVETFRPKVGSTVYSADGVVLGEFATVERRLVPLNEIPLQLQKAFVATEDHKFYQHKGVRPLSLMSAMKDALRTGHMRGASTITQQLVRNVETTGIGQEVTVARKLNEWMAAFQLERRFTKDEILELYLNQIPLGGTAYGVEAASWLYFGKSCRDLTLTECATLAGLTRSPSLNRPDRHPDNAAKRRGIVLAQMVRHGVLTEAEREAAESVPMADIMAKAQARRASASTRPRWRRGRFLAPYFVRYVEDLIEQEGWSHDEELYEEGLEIMTTLDMRLQHEAELALCAGLDAFDEKKREALKRAGKEEGFIPVSGALVCLDNRPEYRGWVRAFVGDRDFFEREFCNATQANRLAGSTVKPYIWAAALDNGYTLCHTELDTPFVRVGWEPHNYGGKFTNGPMTLRVALEKSVNMVAIRLLERLTVPLARSYMERFGIRSDIQDGLALALGTCSVTALDQAVAYSTFAKGGLYAPPTFVREIRDRDGFTRYKDEDESVRALSETTAYLMTYVLQGVAEHGTGASTRALGRPRAGKTGTTNDYRDAWFCGYTPDYTCVVWVGYRDNRPLGRGGPYTGGGLAAPIWTAFMKKAHEGRPVKDFVVPEGIEFHEVDKATGLAGGSFSEAFAVGTAPPTDTPDTQEGTGDYTVHPRVLSTDLAEPML